MKLIYLRSALKYISFDVAIGTKIPFFRVLVTIEHGRSLLQFVTTNCLIKFGFLSANMTYCSPGIKCHNIVYVCLLTTQTSFYDTKVIFAFSKTN